MISNKVQRQKQKQELSLIKFELYLCKEQVEDHEKRNTSEISISDQFLYSYLNINFIKIIELSIVIIEQNQDLWSKHRSNEQSIEELKIENQMLKKNIITLQNCINQTKQTHNLQIQFYKQRIKQMEQTIKMFNYDSTIQNYNALQNYSQQLQMQCRSLSDRIKQIKQTNLQINQQNLVLKNSHYDDLHKYRRLNLKFLEVSQNYRLKCSDYDYLITVLKEKIKQLNELNRYSNQVNESFKFTFNEESFLVFEQKQIDEDEYKSGKTKLIDDLSSIDAYVNDNRENYSQVLPQKITIFQNSKNFKKKQRVNTSTSSLLQSYLKKKTTRRIKDQMHIYKY